MKAIITVIASLGAMSTFVGSAIADVSINLRFGSTPSRHYVSQPVYPSVIHHPRYYERPYYIQPTVIVRDKFISPSYSSERRHNTYQGDRYIVEKRIIRVR